MIFRMLGEFDGLKCVAHVMIHERNHLQPARKIPVSASLHQKADETDNNAGKKIIGKALHTGESKTDCELVHQHEQKENYHAGNYRAQCRGQKSWSLASRRHEHHLYRFLALGFNRSEAIPSLFPQELSICAVSSSKVVSYS